MFYHSVSEPFSLNRQSNTVAVMSCVEPKSGKATQVNFCLLGQFCKLCSNSSSKVISLIHFHCSCRRRSIGTFPVLGSVPLSLPLSPFPFPIMSDSTTQAQGSSPLWMTMYESPCGHLSLNLSRRTASNNLLRIRVQGAPKETTLSLSIFYKGC